MKRLGIVAVAILLLAAGRHTGIAQQTLPPDANPAAPQAADLPPIAGVPPAIMQTVQTDGTARVIVQLTLRAQPEGLLSAAAANAQRTAIAGRQAQEIGRLAGTNVRVVRQFTVIPFMALEVGADALAALAQSPGIAGMQEDIPVPSLLAESVPLVEGTAAWAAGYDGTGWAVAVLDSGVDGSHPFLSGKVVAEACFSARSNCPNGTIEQIGTGAGVHCNYAVLNCTHGTHVAGIVAGEGAIFSGVARGASIIAVQVFSRFTGTDCLNTGNDPCALTFQSDQIAGLEHVYELRNSLNIAAVNMSLGGGGNSNQALCDQQNASRKDAIDLLKSVNIATVISSGNSGFRDQLGAPACISSAVSVGSTTKNDVVSDFSNVAPFLSLLAPGGFGNGGTGDINSSVPGGGFEFKPGTSMAAPHVAGAWAVLRQKAPSASVDTILAALRNTGLPVTDTRIGSFGTVTPRIRIVQALNTFSTVNMTINDVRVSEGHAGTKNATFNVSLSGTTGAPVTALYATSNGSASGGVSLANSALIPIPMFGPATPYPSAIVVPSGPGTITEVRVSLIGFSHTWPRDVDVLLLGPTGQAVMLMSDVGSDIDASNLTFTFADSNPSLPAGGALGSGTFAPTNIEDFDGGDLFIPAPAPPYAPSLSVFNGANPSGAWQLYVSDDVDNDAGSFAGGWSLTINTTAGDYVGKSGPVTIPAGSTSQTISITVNGDASIEPSETFQVTLSNPSGATIADATGIGTIVNDDFTHPVLGGLPIQTVHIVELRAAINEARFAKGLSAFVFTDASLTPQGTLVRAVHLTEMRAALAQAYAAAGQTAPAFTDPVVVPGVTPVRSLHVMELRTAVADLP